MVLFCLVCIAAISEGEISFNSVDWLSEEDKTLQILREKGYLDDNSMIEIQSGGVFLKELDELGYLPATDEKYEDVCFTASFKGQVRGRIGGYPVKGISLTFAYDGGYKLIAVKIDLVGADYDSILKKLKTAYGECETKGIEDISIISNVWVGDNNSAV